MSRIRIKINDVELEYEGSDDFLKEELPLLLDKLTALAASPRSYATPSATVKNIGTSSDSVVHGEDHGDIGTTSTISADLGVKSGPELALAAAVRLNMGLGKPSFTRRELLTEMQSATAYYSKNMSKNLSGIVTGLTKDKTIREIAKDTFSLSAETRRQMESRFGT